MISKLAKQDAASWVGINDVPRANTHVRPSSGVVTSKVSPSNSSINKNVEDAVRTMQNLMSDLGTQLSKPDIAKMVVDKLKSENPELMIDVKYIQNSALKFSRTAANVQYAAAGDGVWGSNTRNSLIAIKNFVLALKIPNVIISEGTGPSPHKIMKDGELINAARENVNNLSRLFPSLGLTTNISSGSGVDNMVVIDSIDSSLPEEGVFKPFDHWGSRPVTISDLGSFYSFFQFIQGLNPNFDCLPLDKLTGGSKPAVTNKTKPVSQTDVKTLAKNILDTSIISLGQEKHRSGHCVSVIDDIIDWFSNRANEMFSALYNAYEKSFPSPRPDRKKDVSANMRDAQLGKYYVEQMQKISAAWESIRDAVIDVLRNQGESPVVTLKTLREATGGRGSVTSGKAHKKQEDTEKGSTGRTVNVENYGKQNGPPLGRFMSLSNFVGFSDALDRVSDKSAGGILPEINLREWSNSAWTSLAQSDVAGRDDAEKYANFGPWAAAIRESLRDIYNDWKQGGHNDQLLESQRDWLNRWTGRINSVLGVWQREFKERMAQAKRGL